MRYKEYRDRSIISAKKLSDLLVKRERTAMMTGDPALMETLAGEIHECIDEIMQMQSDLNMIIDDAEMMMEILSEITGKPISDRLKSSLVRGDFDS